MVSSSQVLPYGRPMDSQKGGGSREHLDIWGGDFDKNHRYFPGAAGEVAPGRGRSMTGSAQKKMVQVLGSGKKIPTPALPKRALEHRLPGSWWICEHQKVISLYHLSTGSLLPGQHCILGKTQKHWEALDVTCFISFQKIKTGASPSAALPSGISIH